MNRVALFAHYDHQNEVKPYILHYLKSLREVCDEIVFVSTSQLSEGELEKVRAYCTKSILVENVGFDFGMWQRALNLIDLSKCDEIVLTNSSVFGPIFPLTPIFERMSKDPCDFWGMTDTFQIRWHIQSYFLVFKRKAIESPALLRFFESVLPYRDKFQLIRSYEVGLAQFLYENGLRPGVLVPVGAWLKSPSQVSLLRRKRQNITIVYANELLDAHMPFVKIQLLRDNPCKVPLASVLQKMQAYGYDMSLVQFDREPPTRRPIAERFRRALMAGDPDAELEMPRM